MPEEDFLIWFTSPAADVLDKLGCSYWVTSAFKRSQPPRGGELRKAAYYFIFQNIPLSTKYAFYALSRLPKPEDNLLLRLNLLLFDLSYLQAFERDLWSNYENLRKEHSKRLVDDCTEIDFSNHSTAASDIGRILATHGPSLPETENPLRTYSLAVFLHILINRTPRDDSSLINLVREIARYGRRGYSFIPIIFNGMDSELDNLNPIPPTFRKYILGWLRAFFCALNKLVSSAQTSSN